MSCLLWQSSCRSLPYREVASRELRLAEAVLLEAQKQEAPVYAPEKYLEAQLRIRNARILIRQEQFGNAKSLAEDAQDIGEQALEETRDENIRIRAQAERLLFRGREIWSRYEKGDEKEYALEALIEINSLLDDGYRYLEKGRHMSALEAAQASHQKLAALPEVIEKGKISFLEEEKKRATSMKTAEQIIKAAQGKAAVIIEDARKRVRKILLEAQVEAARTRMEEFERIYPSTYKVKKGETIFDIAGRREIFNDKFMWPLLYKANRDQIRDPKIVFPGQVLAIPRDLTFEEIIAARKQAEALPPYIPPYYAYNPEFYRRYLTIVPEVPAGKDAELSPAGQE
ncbi:MAG: LysM peptidoglycan-binding domain-containing protein [Deltaproteobacteria bacterium]|nr:LysM peptidoglycan-binding domain-containing protein [Deltaproteobacteria bacterium]